ncbi:MAG: DUF438 domain-containing protein [Chloroflexi bacterium]|nr:DUF438 domain-containing protein [Chloroflexota bacterium]
MVRKGEPMPLDKQAKKEIMKDIIRKLHQGLSVEQAKERFEKEVGTITSTEIADIEQSLINEGLSPEEIKKFCNVHALLFQSALEQSVSAEAFPSHPVYLFRLENREIEKLAGSIKEAVEQRQKYEFPDLKQRLKELLLQLKGVEVHYERKEQLLFPFLEKQGFFGPSKVMWGKDNEVRDLLKKASSDIEAVADRQELETCIRETLNPLIEEVLGMVFKEENILFPTALEKLSATDWVEILWESDEIGYVFIEKPRETEALVKELKTALLEEPVFQDGAVSLPTGRLRLTELMQVLNTLPVDFTFVDAEDTVGYFTDGAARIFHRTRSVIGRKVQNCHPPQSLDVVEKIVASFKEGKRDSFDFWINHRGKFVYIRYFAVRDKEKRYLGALEVTQDVSDIKKLEGEKRLIDERG